MDFFKKNKNKNSKTKLSEIKKNRNYLILDYLLFNI